MRRFLMIMRRKFMMMTTSFDPRRDYSYLGNAAQAILMRINTSRPFLGFFVYSKATTCLCVNISVISILVSGGVISI
jgi:hypothetical protein